MTFFEAGYPTFYPKPVFFKIDDFTKDIDFDTLIPKEYQKLSKHHLKILALLNSHWTGKLEKNGAYLYASVNRYIRIKRNTINSMVSKGLISIEEDLSIRSCVSFSDYFSNEIYKQDLRKDTV